MSHYTVLPSHRFPSLLPEPSLARMTPFSLSPAMSPSSCCPPLVQKVQCMLLSRHDSDSRRDETAQDKTRQEKKTAENTEEPFCCPWASPKSNPANANAQRSTLRARSLVSARAPIAARTSSCHLVFPSPAGAASVRVVSSIRLAACLFAVPEGEIGRRLASIKKDKENKTDASVGLQEFNMGLPLIAAQSAIHGHDLGHRDYAILGAGRRAAKSRACKHNGSGATTPPPFVVGWSVRLHHWFKMVLVCMIVLARGRMVGGIKRTDTAEAARRRFQSRESCT